MAASTAAARARVRNQGLREFPDLQALQVPYLGLEIVASVPRFIKIIVRSGNLCYKIVQHNQVVDYLVGEAGP